jgi:hypothetical protein
MRIAILTFDGFNETLAATLRCLRARAGILVVTAHP